MRTYLWYDCMWACVCVCAAESNTTFEPIYCVHWVLVSFDCIFVCSSGKKRHQTKQYCNRMLPGKTFFNINFFFFNTWMKSSYKHANQNEILLCQPISAYISNYSVSTKSAYEFCQEQKNSVSFIFFSFIFHRAIDDIVLIMWLPIKNTIYHTLCKLNLEL